MLNSLHIENIAVIKSIDIDFSSGFSALTGQTGAGKSIIIDSINFLCGKKVEKELIRKGQSHAMVSGLFTSFTSDAAEFLSESGVSLDEEGNLFIQRSISAEGKSQVKINGRTVSLSVLKGISDILVNIHGQSDTHALTESANHLSILDKFASNDELLAKYRVIYAEYEEIRREIKSISERERERERYMEILEYQIKDIDSLKLTDGEEEELIDKKIKLKNSEKITKQASLAYKALRGNEKGSAAYLLDRSAAALASISEFIPSFAEYSERLKDALYQVEDIAEEVYASIEDMDEAPEDKLNAIEERLDKITKIKRKYGLTIASVLSFRDEAYEELSKLENSAALLSELEKRQMDTYERALSLANMLHERRISFAKALEASVLETLEFLDMPKVVFITLIKENYEGEVKKLSDRGYDSAEFLISANRGLDAKPLSKIASGGELARIMLALKSVIADKDGVMTIVFDEIDAGVSGKTARKIGIKMQSLAKGMQIFSVTHSAQIASLADTHFLIEKKEMDGITETYVTVLDEAGRISELSRILGGIDVTDAQRAAAVDMLKEKQIYKNT